MLSGRCTASSVEHRAIKRKAVKVSGDGRSSAELNCRTLTDRTQKHSSGKRWQ